MKIFKIKSTNKEGMADFSRDIINAITPPKNIFNDIEKLIGKNENWFVKYAVARDILIEAGWKQNIATGLIAAILMVFGGSTLKAAAERNNIKLEDLLKALQNRSTIEKVYKAHEEHEEEPEMELERFPEVQKPQSPLARPKIDIHSKTNFNDIIHTILKHESLVEGQTPFRITGPNMRKWNTIHGLKINKNPNAPKNRQNFIFLENPSEVPIAVKKQFENYAYNPQKYGLPYNPTLEDALKTFDQTGAKGKLNFLKKHFPFLDFSTPLTALLAS